MTRAEAIKQIRSVRATCRGRLSAERQAARKKHLEAGELDAANAVDLNRPGCGADMMDIVCAGPLDGQQHPYTCPECGVQGMYTAPLYEIEDEPKADAPKASAKK